MVEKTIIKNLNSRAAVPNQIGEQLIYRPGKIGDLSITECIYELKPDLTPMDHFDTVYLHNTFKHSANPGNILNFHRRLGWSGIGYHFAIKEDGTIFSTRPIDVQGAHVYGRNNGSVGIVLMDVNKCAASQKARTSFASLYDTLTEISASPLNLHSHPFGQFDFLDKLVIDFNSKIDGPKFPKIKFDASVYDPENFIPLRNQIAENVMRYRRVCPKKSLEDFSRIVYFADKLKICPGQGYAAFAKEVGAPR